MGLDPDGMVFRIEEGAINDGVLRGATQAQVQMLSTSFAGFLELFASELESFAAGTTTPSF